MITVILSNGEAGVALGALRGAKACGVPTRGYAASPPLPGFDLEHDASSGYMSRTDLNVQESDGTVIIGRRSQGTNRTEDVCLQYHKPCLWVNDHRLPGRAKVRLWVKKHQIQVLHLAGNRELVTPGIEALTEEFVTLLLKGK